MLFHDSELSAPTPSDLERENRFINSVTSDYCYNPPAPLGNIVIGMATLRWNGEPEQLIPGEKPLRLHVADLI